jgi:hypothetical protein
MGNTEGVRFLYCDFYICRLNIHFERNHLVLLSVLLFFQLVYMQLHIYKKNM